MIARKLLFAFLFFAATHSAFSQTDKGDFLVGGTFGFKTNKPKSNFYVLPNAGYFFAKNFAAGASFTLDFEKDGDYKTTDVGIGPFLRYYIGQSLFRPFVVGSIDYLYSSHNDNGFKNHYNGLNTLIGLGAAAFISNDVALEGIAAFNHTKYQDFPSTNGFSLNFGFQVYINKGKMGSLRRGKLN